MLWLLENASRTLPRPTLAMQDPDSRELRTFVGYIGKSQSQLLHRSFGHKRQLTIYSIHTRGDKRNRFLSTSIYMYDTSTPGRVQASSFKFKRSRTSSPEYTNEECGMNGNADNNKERHRGRRRRPRDLPPQPAGLERYTWLDEWGTVDSASTAAAPGCRARACARAVGRARWLRARGGCGARG